MIPLVKKNNLPCVIYRNYCASRVSCENNKTEQ